MKQNLLWEETSYSVSETKQIAIDSYEQYLKKEKEVLLLLIGQLGAAKTSFVRLLGEHLDIKDNINSPSFNLLNNYQGDGISIFHYDLYRLQKSSDLENLDFIERWSSIAPQNTKYLHIIEWPELAYDFLPNHIPIFILKIKLIPEMISDLEKSQLEASQLETSQLETIQVSEKRIFKLYASQM